MMTAQCLPVWLLLLLLLPLPSSLLSASPPFVREGRGRMVPVPGNQPRHVTVWLDPPVHVAIPRVTGPGSHPVDSQKEVVLFKVRNLASGIGPVPRKAEEHRRGTSVEGHAASSADSSEGEIGGPWEELLQAGKPRVRRQENYDYHYYDDDFLEYELRTREVSTRELLHTTGGSHVSDWTPAPLTWKDLPSTWHGTSSSGSASTDLVGLELLSETTSVAPPHLPPTQTWPPDQTPSYTEAIFPTLDQFLTDEASSTPPSPSGLASSMEVAQPAATATTTGLFRNPWDAEDGAGASAPDLSGESSTPPQFLTFPRETSIGDPSVPLSGKADGKPGPLEQPEATDPAAWEADAPRTPSSAPDSHEHLLKAKDRAASEMEFVETEVAVALKIFRWLSLEKEANNVVFSPLLFIYTLSMLFLGARGKSSDDINNVFPYDKFVFFNPHRKLKMMSEELTKGSPLGDSTLKTQLILDKSKGGVLDMFAHHVEEYFSSEVKQLSFKQGNPKTVSLRPDAIPADLKGEDIVIRSPMGLLMTTTFQVSWKDDLNVTSGKMDFILYKKRRKIVSVPSVRIKGRLQFNYDADDDVTVAEIPLKDGRVSLLVAVPGHTNSFNVGGLTNLLHGLDKNRWSRLVNSLAPRDITLEMPCIDQLSRTNMTGVLQRLGMRTLFLDSDFSGINGRHNLALGDAFQVSHLSLNAGGGDGDGDLVSGGGPAVKFNRDFLYAVRHSASGFISYLGTFLGPQVDRRQ